MKKVLLIVGGLGHEGIGTFIYNICKNMNKSEIEYHIVVASDLRQPLEEEILKLNVPIYKTADIGQGWKGKILHLFRLKKIIKENGPFIAVHSHMDFFNGFNLFIGFLMGINKRISHAHKAGTENPTILQKIYSLSMKKMILLFGNYYIGCSKEANTYINGISKNVSSAVVVKNGVNFDNYTEILTNKKIRCENNINLIVIGRLELPKNPIFIVEIMNELIKINPTYRLNWIGVGSMDKEVRKLISNYNLEKSIILMGRRNDIPTQLSMADFMLMPSLFEGVPFVLIEAQIMGVPCFISNTVSQDANLGLCTSIKLNLSAKEWAYNINNYIINQTYNNTLNLNKVKEFDIYHTCNQLKKVYLS